MSTPAPAPAEFPHKLAKVRQWLSDRRLAAVALTARHNFSWLTSGRLNYVNAASEGGVATLVVTADRVLCLANRIEAGRMAAEELGDLGIEVKLFEWYDAASAAACLAEHLPGPAATDWPIGGLPAGTVSVDADFDALRLVLLPEELERYRDAGQRTAAAMDAVAKSFPRGITEAQLAGLVAKATWDQDARPWVVLIASDERIARFRHPIATAKKIDQLAMIVLCAERHGLICSATRLVNFGAISADLRRRHEACCRVDAAFLAGTRHGRTLADVFTDAQRAYAAEGFDGEWKLHHQGGFAGYRPREIVATPATTTPIRTPAAFAWNPSITGTKSEDTLLVSPVAHEVITASSDWPMIRCTSGNLTFDRPAILER